MYLLYFSLEKFNFSLNSKLSNGYINDFNNEYHFFNRLTLLKRQMMIIFPWRVFNQHEIHLMLSSLNN